MIPSLHMLLFEGKCFTNTMSFASFFYADSIYTERYMLTPKQNLKGYEVVLLINYFAGSI